MIPTYREEAVSTPSLATEVCSPDNVFPFLIAVKDDRVDTDSPERQVSHLESTRTCNTDIRIQCDFDVRRLVSSRVKICNRFASSRNTASL